MLNERIPKAYREVSGWNDTVVVLTSSFWVSVVIGDVDASFLTPVIVPVRTIKEIVWALNKRKWKSTF